MLKKFLKDESGATAIEYTLIAVAMGGVLVLIMPTITGAFTTEFAVMVKKIIFFT
jgi:Flp pilus assembly pilin Flp